MIKAVIFDFGGVVGVNTTRFIFRALSKKFKKNVKNIKDGILETRIKFQRGEISSNEFWRSLARVVGADDPKEVEDVWTKTYAAKSKINNSVVRIIEGLKKDGYKIALLSNTIKPDADSHLMTIGMFNRAISSFEVGTRKPEEKIYEIVLEKLKNKAEECVFIDDKEINLKTAKNLRMKTILFKNSIQLKSDLQKILKM